MFTSEPNSNLGNVKKYDKDIKPTSSGGWGKYGTIDISDIPNFNKLELDKTLIVQQYYFGKQGSHWDSRGLITIQPTYDTENGIITMTCSDTEGYYYGSTYKAYIYVLI